MLLLLGELIVSIYVAESITTDAGRFGHVGLCQLCCTQLIKAYMAETSCISCYWFCYVYAPDQFTRYVHTYIHTERSRFNELGYVCSTVLGYPCKLFVEVIELCNLHCSVDVCFMHTLAYYVQYYVWLKSNLAWVSGAQCACCLLVTWSTAWHARAHALI